MFNWSGYAAALVARGLSAADARILVRQARALRAPYRTNESLLPFLHARISPDEFKVVLAAVVEAQARGPHSSRWATAWRRLYVEGCPIDHLWCVLWHSFKDPDADPQDFKWVRSPAALRNIDRYVHFQFPRSGAPGTYGPGLGCEQLLENTRRGTRELIRLHCPTVLTLQSMNWCRNVLSRKLRAQVDLAAGVSARGRDDQDEPLQVPEDEIEATVVRWFFALDELRASNRVVHDLSRDRFLLRGERTTAREVRRRPLPRPPRDVADNLRSLVRRWRRKDPVNATTVAGLDEQDALSWLETVAEMAVFLGIDQATGRARIREPERT